MKYPNSENPLYNFDPLLPKALVLLREIYNVSPKDIARRLPPYFGPRRWVYRRIESGRSHPRYGYAPPGEPHQEDAFFNAVAAACNVAVDHPDIQLARDAAEYDLCAKSIRRNPRAAEPYLANAFRLFILNQRLPQELLALEQRTQAAREQRAGLRPPEPPQS